MNLPYSNIEPIGELPDWSRQLEQIAAQPLEFCENFPAVARRHEAWWAGELTGPPLLLATANTRPDRPITRRLELLHDPDTWLEAKFADLRQLHRVEDTLPVVRVNFGPTLMGGIFGGRLEFGSDTGWTHSFINDDWSNAPDWQAIEDNQWWKLLRLLLDRVSAEAAGRFLVCTPDLGGAGDILFNLRGGSQLCMDVLDRPEKIQSASDAIYPGWRRVFADMYRRCLRNGAGMVHWMGLWSNRPYVISACDFNAMISPAHFEKLFLPDICRQAATAGRTVFHLDGPDAARQIDALLDVPEIQAIQYTPGAGTPSAMACLDMFRKIQRRGKPLIVITPADEVLALSQALRPESLAMIVQTPLTPEQLDDLFTRLCQRFE